MHEKIPYQQYAETREEAKMRVAQLLSGSLAVALAVVEEFGEELHVPDNQKSEHVRVESPAIVLPAATFYVRNTNLPIMRRSASWLTMHFKKPTFNGVENLSGETPAYVDTHVRAISLDLLHDDLATHEPMLLAGNRTVNVLGGDKHGVAYDMCSDVMSFPDTGSMDESRNWDAFVAYPLEALSQKMFSHQFSCIDRFEQYLEKFEAAISNSELNPRP